MPNQISQTSFMNPYAAEESGIERSRALAGILQQQGLDPLNPNRMAGNVAVPISPFEGLAKLAQTGVGSYLQNKAGEREKALAQKSQGDYQAMLAKALSQMDADPQGAIATLSSHPQGQSLIPLAMQRMQQQQMAKILAGDGGQGASEASGGMPQGAMPMPPAAPPGGPIQIPQQGGPDFPGATQAPATIKPMGMPQGGGAGLNFGPPQGPNIPQQQPPQGMPIGPQTPPPEMKAPQVDVNASPMQDYQGMADVFRKKAMRMMAINPEIGQNLLASADRLEKMGMEKDIKPIVNENFPVSPTEQQPHEYNRQNQQWVPVPGSAKRPIFNPQPLVRINQSQETAESQGVGKEFAETYNTIQKSGLAANSKINNVNRMSQLLEGVNTGKLAPLGTDIAAAAQSLGFNIDKNLGNKQAAQALANEIALQLRNPSGGAGMPGAMSDQDRAFLVSMTPGIEKSPEGRKLITETMTKIARRDQDVARLARDYRKRNGHLDEGFYEELEKFSNANQLFTGQSGGAGGSELTPAEQKEYETLKKKHGR